MLSSPYTLAQKAKAVAALVGSAVTFLLAVVPVDLELGGVQITKVLAGLAAIATYVATYKIPNADPPGTPPTPEIESTH